MKRERVVRCGWVIALTMAAASAGVQLQAQTAAAGAGDLTGSWQGTAEAAPNSGGKGHRIVLKVQKTGEGGKPAWHGVMYDLDGDDPSQGRSTGQMSFDGGAVRFTVPGKDVTYEGKVSADGRSIAGQVTQNGQQRALTLARAEGDAAWEIPAEDQAMAKDADPDWEVVTVRPGDPNGRNAGFHLEGRQVFVERKTVMDMLLVGYEMHKKQIANEPDWAHTEIWDVKGIPDTPGKPSLRQLQSLVRKALVERFGLVTHTEQREMEVFALTVAKGGHKMTPSAGDPNGLPNENDNGGTIVNMRVENMSMKEFALLMKFFTDKPVVDQTGLSGRFDFQMRWTADESRAPTDGTAPPSLFTAIQEQLGLKLEPVKAKTDVLVIDKLEKPGAN
ncbi:MAG TPA: TIGR03435 family protein [Acidobacteriaceae bacterium]|nr:TIGR03435 family protein [Acidobacteriaceae bacterium]